VSDSAGLIARVCTAWWSSTCLSLWHRHYDNGERGCLPPFPQCVCICRDQAALLSVVVEGFRDWRSLPAPTHAFLEGAGQPGSGPRCVACRGGWGSCTGARSCLHRAGHCGEALHVPAAQKPLSSCVACDVHSSSGSRSVQFFSCSISRGAPQCIHCCECCKPALPAGCSSVCDSTCACALSVCDLYTLCVHVCMRQPIAARAFCVQILLCPYTTARFASNLLTLVCHAQHLAARAWMGSACSHSSVCVGVPHLAGSSSSAGLRGPCYTDWYRVACTGVCDEVLTVHAQLLLPLSRGVCCCSEVT